LVLDGVTQHSGLSLVSLISQDGAPTGRLEAFSFNLRGELIGRYSNGVVDVLGVVALADFPQPTGLSTTHDGLLRETVWSGLRQLGTPDVGGLGRLVARSLETAPRCD
jgi:flagellar hook protein FlgE